MGVTTRLSSTMLDMSRASLEYVCKHVTSPNIARRFGHKLDQKEECTGAQQVSTVYQRSSYNHGASTIATLSRGVGSYGQGVATYVPGVAKYRPGVARYRQGVASYDQDSYWCRSSRSSSRDMDTYEATISTTPGQAGLANRKENLPGMFTFHQNSAKAYLRSSL